MRGTRFTRRKAIVGALALAAVAEVVLALVVVTRGGDGTSPPLALPLHPVAGTFQPDGTQLADCSEQTCFEQAFGNVAYHRGPKSALALLDRLYGDGADPGCHRIVHTIGAASLTRYEGNVARTFAEGSSSCGSGYYHGVLERSLAKVKSYEPGALGAVARGLCADGQVRTVKWLAYQCLHGLGHGLMIATGLGLPLSLEVCNRLTTNWDRTSCKGGAFMENITPSYGVKSRWLRDDDPVYPCNWVAQGDKRTCYQLVTSRILRVVGLDWEKTAEICSAVEKRWVPSCFDSLGRDIAGQTHRNPAEITELCTVARPYGGEDECISAAARDLTANFASGEKATALCDLSSGDLRDACYGAVGVIMGSFTSTPAKRTADCRSISAVERDIAACIRGSRRNESLGVAR